jgi:hypothetical protein
MAWAKAPEEAWTRGLEEKKEISLSNLIDRLDRLRLALFFLPSEQLPSAGLFLDG